MRTLRARRPASPCSQACVSCQAATDAEFGGARITWTVAAGGVGHPPTPHAAGGVGHPPTPHVAGGVGRPPTPQHRLCRHQVIGNVRALLVDANKQFARFIT
jgi:hypothetical protein